MATASIGKQAELAIKVLSASAVLTTIMGWPAVGHHFAAYGIPAELVSTDAAIRAGILPALTVIVVFGYLWYVRSECNRILTSHTDQSMSFFRFQVILLRFTPILIKYIGVYCGVFATLWTVATVFDLANEPWGAVFWTIITLSFVVSIGLIKGYAVLLSRLRQIPYGKELTADEYRNNVVVRLFQLYAHLFEYIELIKDFIALYLIHLALQLVAPNVLSWVSVLSLLVVAAFLSLASSLFVVGMAVEMRFDEMSLRTLKGSAVFAVITVILAVLLYSTGIYPGLSKSLGGGKPVEIDVWFKKSKYPVMSEWPQTKTEEGQLHLASIYLLHLDDKVAILVDQPKPPGRWVVIPRESIELLAVR